MPVVVSFIKLEIIEIKKQTHTKHFVFATSCSFGWETGHGRNK